MQTARLQDIEPRMDDARLVGLRSFPEHGVRSETKRAMYYMVRLDHCATVSVTSLFDLVFFAGEKDNTLSKGYTAVDIGLPTHWKSCVNDTSFPSAT